MPIEPVQDKATPKERHELLLSFLKEHYSGMIDFEFKNETLLSLALGWFITSESARQFLLGNSLARYSLCGMLLLLTCFHSRWVYTFWRRSDTAFKQLVSLAYVQKEYFEFRKIPLFTLVSFIAIHAAVTLVIFALVLGG